MEFLGCNFGWYRNMDCLTNVCLRFCALNAGAREHRNVDYVTLSLAMLAVH